MGCGVSIINLFDRPIAFNRTFVKLGVGITGALMLSQAIYWSKRTNSADGWFYKSISEWQDETGLSRTEQKTARNRLVTAGYLNEVRKGVPAKLYFRVITSKLENDLLQLAGLQQSSMQDSCKQECRVNDSQCAETLQSITENTTEITSETTNHTVAPEASATVAGHSSSKVITDEPKRPRVDIPDDMPGPKDQNAKTFRAWANYAMAYRHRYDAWPIWNARTAGQISQLVDRVGNDLAPAVSAWYLRTNNQFYVTKGHPVSLMLTDCETLAVQCQTGRQVTATKARQTDRAQSNLSAVEEAKAMMRARREQAGGTHADR